MTLIRIFFVLLLALGLLACAPNKFRTYNGPEVTLVEVHKSKRKMYLMHNAKVLKSYKISLGFTAAGPKQFEGDGKTPEGSYFISHKNPRSRYHLSLGISYPNQQDTEFAAANGKLPGGEIFIHGRSNSKGQNKGDWTAGCIAVKDREMEDVFAMVKSGTPIHIFP